MTADWTCFVIIPFVPHKSFKTLKASLMVDVRAAEDCLVIELQILKTNWASLIDDLFLNSYKEVFFNLLPLILAQWLGRLFNKTEPFSQAKLLNVFHSLLLNVVICTLFSLLTKA